MCALLRRRRLYEPQDPVPPMATGVLSVVTSVYPFQFVAERSRRSSITVTNLTEPGAEPHDLELSPRQVGSLVAAGLIIYEKGFQPAVDEAVTQSENRQTPSTPRRWCLWNRSRRRVTQTRARGAGTRTSTSGDHAGELDPHVWLDPTKLDDHRDGRGGPPRGRRPGSRRMSTEPTPSGSAPN